MLLHLCNMRRFFIHALIVLFPFAAPAQATFSFPLLIKPSLSGTFAEIRPNHFHSGIDFRTNEAEGLPVLAVADGYVSRIKISSEGFGKVVYLKHPSGLTTVYAHLHHFNDTLEKLIEAEQYRIKSFEVELFPPEGSLRVQQGQLLGFSGNTGSSYGPHLHFEMRDSKTERPFNPLSRLNRILDTIPPVIRSILLTDYVPFKGAFYPVSKQVLPVNDPEMPSLQAGDTLFFTSLAGIAIETFDLMNESNSMLGVKKIILRVNGAVVFEFEINDFSFSETRYVNACIDYALLTEQGKSFILLHRLPGNDLSSFQPQKNVGFINSEWDESKECEVSVIDFSGNTSSKVFQIKKIKPEAPAVLPQDNRFVAFNYLPVAQTENAKLIFPAGRLTYNIHDFQFLTLDSSITTFSSFVKAGSESIPVHEPCEVFIKTKNLPASLQSKAVAVRLTAKNEIKYAGGEFEGGWIKFKTRTLGNFFVTIDTVPPVIKLSGVERDRIRERNKISFSVTDNLSGIDKYEMTVDGRWVPAGYDAKSGTLYYVQPDDQPAERLVKVRVTDRKGNKSTFTGKINF